MFLLLLYVSCATLIVRGGGMPWPKQTQLIIYAQFGLPAKGRAIKELVGLWVLPNLIPRVFGRKRRYLTPLCYPELLDLTLKCHERGLTRTK